MIKIHPTAIVSKKARLGKNITIGPYTIVHDDVVISDGCRIDSHVVVYDGARIGKDVKIFQGASVSNDPQDLKFGKEKSEFIIGDNTVVREFVTLHRGTIDKGFSRVGKNCLLMAYAHIAHDTIIGNNVIIANGVQVAGHVEIEDHVIIGGITPVHQFVKIGKHVMVGGGFRATTDIPPFVLASGEPLKFYGINSIGLKRRGFSSEEVDKLKKAYMIIYKSGLNRSDALRRVESEFGEDKNVKDITDFLRNSKRAGFK